MTTKTGNREERNASRCEDAGRAILESGENELVQHLEMLELTKDCRAATKLAGTERAIDALDACMRHLAESSDNLYYRTTCDLCGEIQEDAVKFHVEECSGCGKVTTVCETCHQRLEYNLDTDPICMTCWSE